MKKILIIGGGAMGSAFSFPCIDNKNEVTITEPYNKTFIKNLSSKKKYHSSLKINLSKKIKYKKYSTDLLKNKYDLVVVALSLSGINFISEEFKKILLVDDLSDTGLTLNESIKWLKNYHPIKNYIEQIKTACLWKKRSSSFIPDYCPILLESDPWIVQPSEYYDEIDIDGLKKKHL